MDAKIAAGSNLAINGSFDSTPITSPPLGWPTRTLAVVQASATTARSGTNVIKCSPTTATNSSAFTDWGTSATGRTYYVEYWIRADQAIIAANNGLELGMYVSALTTAGTTVNTPVLGSSAAGTPYPKVYLSDLSTTAWTKFAQVFTIPTADTVQARGGFRVPALATAGNTFEIDGFRYIDITEAKSALDAAAAAQAKADLAFGDAQTALTNAGLAQTSANNKNSTYYTASAPSGSGFKLNDIWFRSSDNKVHLWDGDSWEPRVDTAIAAAQTAADGAGSTAVGMANISTSPAPGTLAVAPGAIWQQVDANNTDRIIEQWVANNSKVWVVRKLQDSVFGNINAIKITAGTMSAQRMDAAEMKARWLEAGKVSAVDMVTGTITATSGIIGSLDIGKVTTGEMSGIFIKAFTLQADHMKIGSGTNLFPDPKMIDTAGWPTTAGVTLEGVGTGKNGQGSILIAGSGTQVGLYYSNSDLGKRITVSPNSSYRLNIWVRTSTVAPVGTVSFYARQYPLDGSGFSFTTPNFISNDIKSVGGDGTIPANTWTLMSGVVTTGSIDSALVVGTYKQSGMTGGVRFSDPSIEIMGVGRLIVDGTIQGVHIMTNSISAKHMTITDLTNFAPSLAESPTDWSLTNQMEIVTSGLDASGWRFQVTNATSESRAYGPYMAVNPGENLWMGAHLYRGSGTVSAWLRYYFYDKDKVLLAGGSGTQYVGVPQVSTSAGGVRFEGGALVPAGAAYTRLTFIVSSGTASTGFYNIVGRRRLAGELIIDGTVTSDKVATNGITAKNILVGDFQNFAIGSDFEDAAAVPWTLHADHTISTTQKKSGTSSLRLAAGAGARSSTFVGDLRVKEGEQYYFKLHAYIDATFNGAANSKLRISDQTGGPLLGNVSFTGITRSVWTTTPLETTVTVPAGVTSLTVVLTSDHTVGTAYIDDIQIRRVSEASLIMNLGVEKLTAATALIDTAVVNKFYSEVVRSRRMTTDVMAVGRGVNGIVDEYFEQADTNTYRDTLAGGWGAYGVSGSTSLNFYGGSLTAGTSRSFFFDTMAPTYDKTTYIPVEPGQVWLLKAQYTSGTSGPRATVRYIKRDGTTAYQSAGWTKRDGTTNSYGVAGSVLTLERIYTVPADVAYIMPAVQFESTCTSANIYGGATFTNMATSSLVVDGAITARNLTVTEEMWTNILHFKLLTGDEIDVNSLTADTGWIGTLRGGVLINDAVDTGQLKATAITSKHTITGATIQTIVTANRGIKMTSSSLKAYNTSTSANTFTLDAATGDVLVSTLSTSATGARVKVWDDFAGRAQIDMYTDTSGQHGSLYTEPQAGNGGYVTNVMHYTASPATTTNWTARLTLFADQTWALGSRTAVAQITGDGSGNIYMRGKMIKNNGAATTTETFLVGTTVAQSNATGSISITYAAPVGSGTRTVVASADSASVAQIATQSATGSGVTFLYSTTASSNLTVRFLAVWTT